MKTKYTEDFLTKNGFEKEGANVYHNGKVIIIIRDDHYEFTFYCGDLDEDVTVYSNDLSVYCLVGFLTWNDLMDKNYNK